MELLRWNAVRGILQSSQLDAVLLVLGVDCCFNEGCSRLFDFLFVDTPHPLRSKAGGDEDYEDTFVVIAQTAIHVYCNPNNAHFVLPTASKLHDVQLHCLSAHQVESNGPLSEDYKAQVFVNILKDLHRIGVPYCGAAADNGSSAQFDPMKLEAWPLVQAYAAEDLGGHGFFTLTHTVVDITSDLDILYNKLDPLSLACLMKKGVPGHLQQWMSALNVSQSSVESVDSLTHEKLSQNFGLYTKHWLAQGPPLRECEPSGVWPGHLAQLYGSLTSGAVLCDDHCKYPVHMVCHLCDPRGPLCVSRTYFPVPIHPDLVDDAWLVRRLYCSLSAAVRLGIETYVETQRPQKTMDVITKSFVEMCGHMGITEPLLTTLRDNLVIGITHVDLAGRSQQTQRGVWRPLLNQITAKVNNIPSTSHPHETLGTLAYGDTFVDSVVILDEVEEEGSQEEDVEEDDEQDEGQDVRHFVLTSQVPVLRSIVGAQALQCKTNIDECQMPWGESVGDVGDIHLVNPVSPDCPVLVKVRIFRDALVLSEPVFGVVAIPHKVIRSLQYYNREQSTSSAAAVLVVTLSEAARKLLPVEMLSEEDILVLLAQHHTAARKNLEKLKDLFQHMQELPEALEKIYQCYAANLSSYTALEVDKDTAIRNYELHFSRHFELACSLHHPIHNNVLQSMLSAKQTTVEGKVVVSIVTGTPGSYQDTLVSELSSKAEAEYKWILLQQPFDHTQEFSVIQLQESLATIVLNTQKKIHGRRRSLMATKRCHVLLQTPGLTGVLEVLQAICTHPQKFVADACTIGAIVLCLDAANMFICGRTPFPNLLHNMNLATTVVLTGSQQHGTLLQEAQQWIKCCNPKCKVILAPRGVISTTSDAELIIAEKRWKGVDALMDGHVSCSGHICVHTLQPKFNVVVLRFITALSRRLLDKKCSELIPIESPVDLSQPEGLIYHMKGCIQFGDCSVYQYEYTRQSSNLCVSELDQNGNEQEEGEPVQSVVAFIGIGLKEDALKLWLQACQHEATVVRLIRTKQDLTADELNQLKQKCLHLPLPPGIYFSGQYYTSLDGEKSTDHPSFDDVIDAHLAEQNGVAREHNASVKTEFIWI